MRPHPEVLWVRTPRVRLGGRTQSPTQPQACVYVQNGGAPGRMLEGRPLGEPSSPSVLQMVPKGSRPLPRHLPVPNPDPDGRAASVHGQALRASAAHTVTSA